MRSRASERWSRSGSTLRPGLGRREQKEHLDRASHIQLGFPRDAVQLEQTADGPVSLANVLSIPVNPGDQFYLVVSSAATAGGVNAFAESLSTLTISFDPSDAANLEAANAPPSVPSMSWPFATLLVLAFIGRAFASNREASIPA